MNEYMRIIWSLLLMRPSLNLDPYSLIKTYMSDIKDLNPLSVV